MDTRTVTVTLDVDLTAIARFRRARGDLDATRRRAAALLDGPVWRPATIDPRVFCSDADLARAVSRHLDGTGDLTDRSIAASIDPDEYRAWVRSIDTCRRAVADA